MSMLSGVILARASTLPSQRTGFLSLLVQVEPPGLAGKTGIRVGLWHVKWNFFLKRF